MSRIHEALKKAELERAAQAVMDAPPVPIATTDKAVTQHAEPLPETAASSGVKENISDLIAHCRQPVWQPNAQLDIFSSTNPHHLAAEQFRTLRSRLYQLRGNQPLNTLLVTSSLEGEGKTFVSYYLARALTHQSDRRVLVIDADLRRSHLHVMFGAPPNPGLSDYLSGTASETEVIQHGREGNLFLIPGGNPHSHPSELIANGRLRNLLERVSGVFDWILIDSPPYLPVADGRALADSCDGVLLVVRAGLTPAAVVARSRQELNGHNVLGVVLNSVEKVHGYGSYYTYGAEPAPEKQ